METNNPNTSLEAKKNAGKLKLETKGSPPKKKEMVHGVGQKTKKPVSKKIKQKNQPPKNGPKEFQLDLGVLDGYDLPAIQDEEDVQLSKPKRFKNSQPEVLGVDYREMEEKRLEELLFGELIKKIDVNPQAIKSEKNKTSKKPPQKGKGKVGKQSLSKGPGEGEGSLPQDVYGTNLGISSVGERKAAWVDEDDEALKCKSVQATKETGLAEGKGVSDRIYKKVLEQKFASIHGHTTPKWAQLGKKDEKKSKQDSSDEVEDRDLTKTAADLLMKDSVLLPQEILNFLRMSDINKETRAEGVVIKSVEFHKKQNVALVAGNSGVLSLFEIGGSSNAKIQSITFKQFPIHMAHFSPSGEEVIASSHATGNIQAYNLINGRSVIIPHNKQMDKGSYKNFVLSPDGKLIAYQGQYGYIHLMSARSKEWITSLKMNGEVNALTFNPDGTKLYSHGEFGEVYVWDMNTRTCVHKFVDDGCITGTALAMSPTQQYLACGSSSGVVNLYNTSNLENNSLPKPDKVILNLVTRISGINFHPSSELVSIFSDAKENAVRLAHFPSMTVFKNFPVQKKDSYRVTTMDFSPSGGYMAAGFNNGSAHLYRLNHYDQY
ncbi:U3 small nucleolar RNA-associated protein 18 homolog [Daphnia carinata]|uniref:U3 small nucleolar RNA-associated protein 18 homolog n=1 Tax=Daphnia carinata TaxID=120202 RepID=UPI00257E3498|nr:U3 small nucleolar RNA-associated protein 18 homolog [Daphnia carinata]